jgi:hypothetical protein
MAFEYRKTELQVMELTYKPYVLPRAMLRSSVFVPRPNLKESNALKRKAVQEQKQQEMAAQEARIAEEARKV